MNGAGAGATYNPEIELSTDTDDSCSEAAGEHRAERREHRAPHREHRGDRGERVVEQVRVSIIINSITTDETERVRVLISSPIAQGRYDISRSSSCSEFSNYQP